VVILVVGIAIIDIIIITAKAKVSASWRQNSASVREASHERAKCFSTS